MKVFRSSQSTRPHLGKPRKLAYMVAFGRSFFYKLGQFTIDSLVKTGFDGDIVVLVENDYHFKHARTIKLKEDLSNAPAYAPHMCRALIHKYVNMSNYDSVLYLDTDVLAIKNVNPILATAMENDCLSVSISPTGLHKHWHYGTMTSKADRDLYLSFRKPPSICSGIYAIPGSKVEETFDLWTEMYYEALKDPSKFVCDQSVLCEAIYMDIMPAKYLPMNAVYYPKYNEVEPPEATFLHHCAVSYYPKKYKYLKQRLGKIHDHKKAF